MGRIQGIEKMKNKWQWRMFARTGPSSSRLFTLEFEFPPKRTGHFDVSMPLYWPKETDSRGCHEAWYVLNYMQKNGFKGHAFNLEATQLPTEEIS